MRLAGARLSAPPGLRQPRHRRLVRPRHRQRRPGLLGRVVEGQAQHAPRGAQPAREQRRRARRRPRHRHDAAAGVVARDGPQGHAHRLGRRPLLPQAPGLPLLPDPAGGAHELAAAVLHLRVPHGRRVGGARHEPQAAAPRLPRARRPPAALPVVLRPHDADERGAGRALLLRLADAVRPAARGRLRRRPQRHGGVRGGQEARLPHAADHDDAQRRRQLPGGLVHGRPAEPGGAPPVPERAAPQPAHRAQLRRAAVQEAQHPLPLHLDHARHHRGAAAPRRRDDGAHPGLPGAVRCDTDSL
mmetsp:Transcript_22342/g.78289  ORF Transcript_22342/g.78289 Transcript_22342/m.78289 type:complete len:301 (-) Transcript_22342:128-1030(-)